MTKKLILLLAAATLTATIREVFLSEKARGDLTPQNVDAMNVMSQWLFANRARQEIVRLDALSANACADAADAVRHVLLTTTLTPRVAQVDSHVR